MAQLFPDPADSSVESSAKNGQLYGDVVPGEYFQVAIITNEYSQVAFVYVYVMINRVDPPRAFLRMRIRFRHWSCVHEVKERSGEGGK